MGFVIRCDIWLKRSEVPLLRSILKAAALKVFLCAENRQCVVMEPQKILPFDFKTLTGNAFDYSQNQPNKGKNPITNLLNWLSFGLTQFSTCCAQDEHIHDFHKVASLFSGFGDGPLYGAFTKRSTL
jgi:hypothetical protein